MSSNQNSANAVAQVPNTMALPCVARRAVYYHGTDDLPLLQALFDEHGTLRVLGGASNVILPARLDEPLVLMRNKGISLVGQTDSAWLVEVAAGENWHDWVAQSLARGWPGLENLALIPGTVGAAPVQNIGAYGLELDERLDAVEIWDFESKARRWLSVAQCQFSYRDSIFKSRAGQHWLVLTIRFALPKSWQPVLDYPDLRSLANQQPERVSPQMVFDLVVSVRQAKLPDPAIKPNVGSFFKNPVVSDVLAQQLTQTFAGLVSYPQGNGRVKLAAGWLIDQCGLKGKRMGRMSVHDRQALVLVNEGGATADDVMALANEIVSQVSAKFGIILEMEPVRW